MIPKVSIVVPVFNCENYINRCVDSLLEQTLKELEIILVNDGSTDNSAAICHNYSAKFSNILAIDQPNGGASKARETGIKAASGEYIGFIDCDDWMHPKMFESIYTIAIEKQADIVQCSFKRTQNTNDKSIVYDENSLVQTVDSFSALRQLLCVDQEQNFNFLLWNKIFRRTIFDKFVYPVHIQRINDVPVIPRAFYYANKVAYTEQAFVYYFERNNIQNKSIMDELRASKAQMIYSHIEAFYDITEFFEKLDQTIYQYSIYLLLGWVFSGIRSKDKTYQMKKIINDVLYNKPVLKNPYISRKYKIYVIVARALYYRKIKE